jgi:hypothetical protein
MLLTGVVAIGLLNPVTAVLGLVLVVMGLIRVVETFGAWSEPARIDASTLQPPPADAPGNRCGQHPTLMSLGSCPRCGTWSCRACAPDAKFPATPCLACSTSKSLRKERLQKTERGLMMSAVTLTGLLVAMGLFLLVQTAPGTLSLTMLATVIILTVLYCATRLVWLAVALLPFFAVTTGALCFGLAAIGWGALALIALPLSMAGLGAVLTLASTQRSYQQALRNAAG